MKTKAPFALLPLIAGLASCGVSPLLNHEEASRARLSLDSARAAGECPLSFPNSKLCASYTWESPLNGEVENSFVLRFWDSETGSSNGPYRNVEGDVAVEPWMTSMGHGTRPAPLVTPQGSGIYRVHRIWFSMNGPWDIRVQIKKNQQLLEQSAFGIRI